jgi:hypothetical protein
MLQISLATGYALLVPLLSSFTRAQTAYQSIYTVDAFAAQPTCVQDCFTVGYGPDINCNTDVLGSLLGCPNTPCMTAFAAVDSCYCRGDLQAAANELLGSCINEVCSVGDNSVNLATAASIYSNYCLERGFTAAPASMTTTAKSQTKSGTAAPTTTKVQPSATSTSPSPTDPSSTTPSSGTNTLVIVAASVGTLIGVAILVAAITCWIRRPRPPQSPPRPSCLKDHVQMDSTDSWVSRLSEPSVNDSTSQVGYIPSIRPNARPYQEPSMVHSDISNYQQSAAGQAQGYNRK